MFSGIVAIGKNNEIGKNNQLLWHLPEDLKNFKSITTGKTIIMVAQRVSTIMNAEQIIVLEDGKIVGKGTHEELLKNCETYKQIALSQLSSEELERKEV